MRRAGLEPAWSLAPPLFKSSVSTCFHHRRTDKRRSGFHGAQGETRTPTALSGHQILSLACLPFPSPAHGARGETRTLTELSLHQGLNLACLPNSTTRAFGPRGETRTPTRHAPPGPRPGASTIPPLADMFRGSGLPQKQVRPG